MTAFDVPATNTIPPLRPPPFAHREPKTGPSGLIVACPHSGRFYPPELLKASRLDAFTLRRSEDAFVDILMEKAPDFQAHLVTSQFGRAFVDVNRHADELDPALIHDLPELFVKAPSERVKAGLGVIPRTVGEGYNIYLGKMTYVQARARLAEVHVPWHAALDDLAAHVASQNGLSILMDCHSMPAAAAGNPACDIVLGDRFGESCAPIIINTAASFLRREGFVVARNNPFAGGYATVRHGKPLLGRHALQMEINRSLYLEEGTLKPRVSFRGIQDSLTRLIEAMSALSLEMGANNRGINQPSTFGALA